MTSIKIVMAFVLILTMLYIILAGDEEFMIKANQAAEQGVEDAKAITCEIYGLEDDMNRQEVRQEYILEEVRKK